MGRRAVVFYNRHVQNKLPRTVPHYDPPPKMPWFAWLIIAVVFLLTLLHIAQ